VVVVHQAQDVVAEPAELAEQPAPAAEMLLDDGELGLGR
jgi:hypothetical protein